MQYNYFDSVKADVIDAIGEYDVSEYTTRESLEEYLNDVLFVDDSVTGNASGSYTMSTYQAEENLSHNWDLLVEAAETFGVEPEVSEGWEHGAEWWDVTIRCYLLPQAISAALDELDY